MINQLQHNIVWGQKGNFVDVPTDCPQRDERLGWTGDAQVFIRTACFNRDVAGFFTKWLADLAAEQASQRRRADGHPRPDEAQPVRPHGPAGRRPGPTRRRSARGRSTWPTATRASWNSSTPAWPRGSTTWPGRRATAICGRPASTSATGWTTAAAASIECHADHRQGADRHRVLRLLHQPAATGRRRCWARRTTPRNTPSCWRKIKAAFTAEFVSANGRVGSNSQTSYVLALHFDLLPGRSAAEGRGAAGRRGA